MGCKRNALQLKWNHFLCYSMLQCVIMLGGSRYVPGSSGAAGESAAVTKADPFTGSTRYVPAGAASSTAGSAINSYVLVSQRVSTSFIYRICYFALMFLCSFYHLHSLLYFISLFTYIKCNWITYWLVVCLVHGVLSLCHFLIPLFLVAVAPCGLQEW